MKEGNEKQEKIGNQIGDFWYEPLSGEDEAVLPSDDTGKNVFGLKVSIAMNSILELQKNIQRFWRSALKRVYCRLGTCINRPLH